MVFNLRSSPASTCSDTDSDTESRGKIGFCGSSPRICFGGPSSPAITDSDTESRGTAARVVFTSGPVSYHVRNRGFKVLADYPGVHSVIFDVKEGKWDLVGVDIDIVQLLNILRRKIGFAEIMRVGPVRRNDTFLARARITELQEQSENQQEDQTPPRQANSLISRPSQGTSNQTQAAADHAPQLSFPFAPSSSHTFRTESLAFSPPAQSSICGGACLPEAKNLREAKGLGGHDQLSDPAVRRLLSGNNGIGELKRGYGLRAGEQASRLKEMEDTAIMLCKQVEELEAKLSTANMLERCLRDILSISEDRHAGTKRELALMQEKLEEANSRIEYLENERAEEKACRACRGREAMIAPRPDPVAPRTTSLRFVPSPSPRPTDLEGCKESALFPELTYLFGNFRGQEFLS